MTKEEIRNLAERIATGLATDEEIRLYNTLYNAMEASASGSISVEADEKEKLRASVHESIRLKLEKEKPVLQIGWLKWAAAVLIVAVLGSVVYLVSNKDKPASGDLAKKDTLNNQQKIAAPDNKARLTLTDGTVIALDDSGNDTLVQEGGIKVVKLSKGILSYQGNRTGVLETSVNTVSTPAGGQYRLVLEDGTNVWLNVASSLRFPPVFQGKERIVELTGEAYFEVAHDARRPFHVKLNGLTVEVLGTHFNINSYRDESAAKTTLLEGSVRISANKQQVLLRPNEQLVFDHSSQRIQKLQNVNIEDVVAWKEGRFRFHQMSIEAIMRQVARWYNVEVEYKGRITNELFSGDVSRQEDVDQLLDILRATKIVSFQLEGNKITVTTLK
jgi:transmembrane sensor